MTNYDDLAYHTVQELDMASVFELKENHAFNVQKTGKSFFPSHHSYESIIRQLICACLTISFANGIMPLCVNAEDELLPEQFWYYANNPGTNEKANMVLQAYNEATHKDVVTANQLRVLTTVLEQNVQEDLAVSATYELQYGLYAVSDINNKIILIPGDRWSPEEKPLNIPVSTPAYRFLLHSDDIKDVMHEEIDYLIPSLTSDELEATKDENINEWFTNGVTYNVETEEFEYDSSKLIAANTALARMLPIGQHVNEKQPWTIGHLKKVKEKIKRLKTIIDSLGDVQEILELSKDFKPREGDPVRLSMIANLTVKIRKLTNHLAQPHITAASLHHVQLHVNSSSHWCER